MRGITTILLLCSLTIGIAHAEWQVPANRAEKVAPFRFSDDTRKQGDILYRQNCASCHGNPGKADYVKLDPLPGDIAGEKFAKQPDGSLFYKITTGRSAMPAFKDVLTEEQRWWLVSFVRTFHKNYIQPEPVILAAGTYSGMQIEVTLSFDTLRSGFLAIVSGKKENKVTLLQGIELALYAQRYFGRLPVNEPQTTNASGEAFFSYPQMLPGDTVGNIEFIVRINTEGLTSYQKAHTIKAGLVSNKPSLTSERAMWNIASKSPLWLIVAYCSAVLAVWLVLAYIVIQVLKIRKLNKTDNQNTI